MRMMLKHIVLVFGKVDRSPLSLIKFALSYHVNFFWRSVCAIVPMAIGLLRGFASVRLRFFGLFPVNG